MKTTLIKNAIIVNEGKQMQLDLLIAGDRIARIDKDISAADAHIIDAAGMFLIPGAIDDQVHFREPGLTHKGEIYTEAKAAVFPVPVCAIPKTSCPLIMGGMAFCCIRVGSV